MHSRHTAEMTMNWVGGKCAGATNSLRPNSFIRRRNVRKAALAIAARAKEIDRAANNGGAIR